MYLQWLGKQLDSKFSLTVKKFGFRDLLREPILRYPKGGEVFRDGWDYSKERTSGVAMTYTFKLARRLARFRTGMLLGIVFTSACAGTDSAVGPESGSNPLSPTSLDVFPDSASIDVSGEMQFAAQTVADSEGTAATYYGRGRWRRIVRVKLNPDSVAVAAGTVRTFAASGQTAYGSVVTPFVRWTATGGTVDSTGKYIAGTLPGKFRVIATAIGDVADTATVVITPPGQTIDRVELNPTSATLAAGATQQFTAVGKTGEGATVPTLATFSATGGTIGHSGLYTAGQTAGTYRVIATDSAAGRADTAVVTITGGSPAPAPVLEAVVLSPPTVSLAPGGQQDFNAVGKMTDGSTKSINVSYTATGGAITTAGIYAAGIVAGSYSVIATLAGGTLADTAAVTITAPVPTLQAVVLTPASVTLQSGATQQFAVSGRMSDGSTTPVNVTYSATGGTITSSGNYTAGSVAGSYRVIATQNGGTLADTSTVSVTTPPPSSSCLRTVNVSTMASLTTALNAALPGDCILMAAGTYGASANLTISRSGTSANPIVIQGPGSSAILDMNQRILSQTASYVQLRKFRITDMPGVGFWLSGVTGAVLDSMELDHSGQELLKLYNASHHNTIKNSWFHHSGQTAPQYGEAIYISNSGNAANPLQFTNTYNQILHNRFGPNVPGDHIDLKPGADRTTIRGNTFDGTGAWAGGPAAGNGANVTVGSSHNVIDGNTVQYGKPHAFGFAVGGGVAQVGNLITNNVVDLQNILNLPDPRYGFNFTVNTNNPTSNAFKCSNTTINGTRSNMACTP